MQKYHNKASVYCLHLQNEINKMYLSWPKSNGPIQAVQSRFPERNKLTMPKLFKLNRMNGMLRSTTRS